MSHGRALFEGTLVGGEWRIERVLGQGGFGVTYEARHRTTGAHAALKEYMPSGLCTRVPGSSHVTAVQGPTADIFKRGLAGFIKEAETLARLDHPSIVRVAEFFEANGTAYMALAFESGGNLSQWLAGLGRRPTQAELDRLIWPITEALIQVHSLHLLHRDIKPDNIMLRGDGTPVLIDFGAIKQLVSSRSRAVNGPATLNVATDGYAPPEQYVASGETLLGPWTDVYALGATLYEAVSGRPPPDAPHRTVEDNYRPLAKSGLAGPDWRPAFLDGVDRSLALKRSDRPQSVVEFRRAIGLGEAAPDVSRRRSRPLTTQRVSEPASGSAHVVTARPVPATSQPPQLGPGSQTRLMSLAAALVALLVAGGAWWMVQQQTPKADPAVQKAEAERRIAEANAGRLEAEAKARRLAEEKAAADNATKAKAADEARRIAAEKVKDEEAARHKIAAENTRRAQDEARRRDPIAALAPGSGQSARDTLADGSPCAFCPELVVVPTGSFTMGSPANEPQRNSNEQQVQVTIPRPFAVGKFAVTFDEWDACVADGGCGGYKPADQGWGRGKRPVINVNWNDAKVFAAWLSVKTGKTYRLPSEAEREYVTRAGTTTPFWWGSSITPAQANYDGSVEPYKGGGSKGEYRRQTLPVDSFQANPWGLFNVHGNVLEWTEDCWIDRNTGNPGNGEARTSGCTDASRRVVRGGTWDVNPRDLRSALRSWGTAGTRGYVLGFRLARSIEPAAIDGAIEQARSQIAAARTLVDLDKIAAAAPELAAEISLRRQQLSAASGALTPPISTNPSEPNAKQTTSGQDKKPTDAERLQDARARLATAFKEIGVQDDVNKQPCIRFSGETSSVVQEFNTSGRKRGALKKTEAKQEPLEEDIGMWCLAPQGALYHEHGDNDSFQPRFLRIGAPRKVFPVVRYSDDKVDVTFQGRAEKTGDGAVRIQYGHVIDVRDKSIGNYTGRLNAEFSVKIEDRECFVHDYKSTHDLHQAHVSLGGTSDITTKSAKSLRCRILVE